MDERALGGCLAGPHISRNPALSSCARLGTDRWLSADGDLPTTIHRDGDRTLCLVGSAPGRDKATLRTFFDQFGPDGSAQITHVSADQAVTDLSYYADFGDRVESIRTDLRALLGGLKERGASIAAYGAAAKARPCSTTSAWTRTESTSSWIGMPGVHVPILATEELPHQQPDYTLLLAWNFPDEIMAQQDDYRQARGRFVIPIATPHIVA